MRALIREPGETVTERDGVTGIDWNTGSPLTNSAWCGGPYHLVQDFVEPVEGPEEPQPVRSDSEDTETQSPSVQSTPVEEKSSEQPSVDLTETVTYGGKEYTLEELKKLIQ